MLYEAHRHEPLARADWDPERASETVREIIRDTVGAYRGDVWPAHPRDNGSDPSATLYQGAAGVLTALESLRNDGYEISGIDLDEAWRETWRVFRRAPFHDSSAPSLLCGASGILLPAYGALDDASFADRLLEEIRDNADNPAREFMWGAPGTMAAAHQMYEWTDDERWADAYEESASGLWEHWWRNDRTGCYLWTQQFPRRRVRWIGACHGQFGSIDALLRGRDLLPPLRREVLFERAEDLLETLAFEEEGLVNWPAVAAEREPRMVQWCHGATGAVTAYEGFPQETSETVDDLLQRAGELIWEAGPLKKGPNLCHGTAGNGYALLKLWRRTGGEQWLDRARRFAMHGIEQYRRLQDEWRRGWYSLYTGDLGLALFLQSCLDEDPRIPGLDFWPRR